MICSSYRSLHFEILKLKQIFRSNVCPRNFVDHCIKMYLDKVFLKFRNMCIVPKKELVCFPISQQKVIRNQKATAKCY